MSDTLCGYASLHEYVITIIILAFDLTFDKSHNIMILIEWIWHWHGIVQAWPRQGLLATNGLPSFFDGSVVTQHPFFSFEYAKLSLACLD